MPANPVLIDSSYYIRELREGRDPLMALAAIAAERPLAVCGVVRCEVARGLRHPNTLKRFQNFWDVMENVPTDNRLWAKVEQTIWQLDRAGIVLPLQDVVVACCALAVNATLLTYDGHFGHFKGLRVISELPG
jgi:predicted nucleic acid-binding protein